MLPVEQSTFCANIETGLEPEPAVTLRVADNVNRLENDGKVESIETVTQKVTDYDNQVLVPTHACLIGTSLVHGRDMQAFISLDNVYLLLTSGVGCTWDKVGYATGDFSVQKRKSAIVIDNLEEVL